MLNESGKLVGQGEVPGKQVMSNGIAIENWNERGQHAFLPQCGASKTNLLRLKSNGNYRTLPNLPHFDENTLQDLKFSPDGECLYVLGKSRLWIVGAQSAKLLRIVKPRWGRRWSDENAALSPDCRRILGMRGKMALFSTINGQLLNRFGVKVETLTGGCGSLELSLAFPRMGVLPSLRCRTSTILRRGFIARTTALCIGTDALPITPSKRQKATFSWIQLASRLWRSFDGFAALARWQNRLASQVEL